MVKQSKLTAGEDLSGPHVGGSASRASKPEARAIGSSEPPADEHRLDEVLTPRECEIASGVYNGLSNKEIARQLEISPWTVSSHLRQVFAKLGITRRIELCRMWHGSVKDKAKGATLG